MRGIRYGILVAGGPFFLAAVLLIGRSARTTPDVGSQAASAPSPRPAAQPLAPDVASYDIEATLSPDGKVVQGREVLRYRNVSSDQLEALYLHLYLNAFRSADTVWMREARGGMPGFQFDPSYEGWIRVDSISSVAGPLLPEPDESGTIARVGLPRALLPGEELSLNIAWTAQLPRVFARTGWAPGGFTMVGQWYPKMAVYDARRGGWDREPWHANAEFFHDFGSYTLSVSVPSKRSVLATGEQVGAVSDNGDGTARWQFRASGVTDVAWMAAEAFALRSWQAGEITVTLGLPAASAGEAARYRAIADYALARFGEWLGPYPWPHLAIVVPPESAGAAGGMEYPMLVTTILPPRVLPAGVYLVEGVTAHELAHEWFPMQVASDEARDPWLDEAFAEYLAERVVSERYGADRSLLDWPFARLGYADQLRFGLSRAARLPITRPSWEYTAADYGAAVYGKGGLLLATLERVYGREAFTKALAAYVSEWRWRHPTAADSRAMLSAHLPGGNLVAEGAPVGVDAWLDQLAFGERVLEVRVAKADAAEAVAERVGDALLPIEGTLDLAPAGSRTWVLPPEATKLSLAPDPGESVVALRADPRNTLLIEPNRVDDGLTVDTERAALAGMFARWIELMTAFLQALGQFG